MRILIAPDKFKDALDAPGVAAAIAAGVRAARPDAEMELCPLGDGGEGTGRVLADTLGAEERATCVVDPLGRERSARWWVCRDRHTAVVEMAEASGLALLAPGQRDALRTTSFGTGQLLKAAAEAGCSHVLLCVGGSASVDGGAGCLQALGWEFLDQQGAIISPALSGGMLSRIAAVRPPVVWKRIDVDILCDVNNPLLGPRGAARVFGPQKGASPAAVEELERGLAHWAEVLWRCCGHNVATLASGGAAGGLPAGLVACLAAHILPGFDEVARRVSLRDKLPGCDLCLTGEGCIDDQTADGKTVAGVARLARACGVATVALAGAARLRPGLALEALAEAIGVERIVVITPVGTALPEALRTTAGNLRRAAQETLAAWR